MKVFLSHASDDGAIAKFLKASFVSVGVTTFMLPDDAPPGSAWMEQIREGLNSSEELVTLVTPTSITRPWISAEWACFWLNQRTTTPLLVGTRVSDMWDPMKASQAVDLLDPSQSLSFFKRLADRTKVQPAYGVLPLAQDVAEQIPEIKTRSLLANIEAVMTRLSRHMTAGTENIHEADVLAAVSANRIHDVVTLATADQAAPVKQRQAATALVKAGRPGEAFRIATSIHNRNEIKNVVLALLQTMNQHLGEESEEWLFLMRIHEHLGDPQRRNIRDRMLDLGLYPRGPWLEDEDKQAPS